MSEVTCVCYAHQVKPIKIYGQCVACEIADLRDENVKLLADYAVTANDNARLRRELEKYMKRVKILMDGYDKIFEGEGLPVTIAAEYVAEAMKVRAIR